MSKEAKIYKALAGDDIAKEILAYCKASRLTEQIMQQMYTYLKRRYPASYPTPDKVRDPVGIRLNNLEQGGAISFTEGKWKTSAEAESVMSKYFGL